MLSIVINIKILNILLSVFIIQEEKQESNTIQVQGMLRVK